MNTDLQPHANQPALARFTNTHLAWLGILGLALATRATLAGAAPLNNAEAAQALNALQAASGVAAGFDNPLFGWLQSVALAVFGSGEFSARLWSILSGALFCLAPAALSAQKFGKTRPLLMGGLLVMSPGLWFVSRQATGVMLAWALAFWGWALWQREARRPALVAFGFLLACGTDAVLPLLVVSLAQLVGQIQIENSETRLSIGLAPHTYPSGADWLFALTPFVLGSTGFLTRLGGMGDAMNGWLMSLRMAHNALPLNRAALGALVYEPLAWVFALAAPLLMVALKIQPKQEQLVFGWAAPGLMALLTAPLFGITATVPFVIGCGLLASFTLAQVFEGAANSQTRGKTFAVMATLFVMLMVMDVGLRNYAGMGQALWLVSGLLALAMTMLAAIAFALMFDLGSALRGLALAAMLALGLHSAANAVRLTKLMPFNPAEPYITEGAAEGLHTMLGELDTLSIRAYSDRGAIPMQVADTAPASLRWALRNERKLGFAAKPQNAEALILPQNAKPEGTNGFVGAAFEIGKTANLASAQCIQTTSQLNCQPLAKWLIFRELSSSTSQDWTLWVRSDLAARAAGK